MTAFRVCDKCGCEIGSGGFLNVASYSLEVNADLCAKCATAFVAWVKEKP